MSTVNFSREYMDAHRTILSNPGQYNFPFKPFKDCFAQSDTVTAKHILAEQYIKYIDKPVIKLVVYVLMNEIFGEPFLKDSKGNLGYSLTLNTAQ